MTLAELTPDIALKALLDGIQLQISETEIVDVMVYAENKAPNVGLDDAFIYIYNNGVIQSVTKPLGHFKGTLAISINVRCNDDGTAKTNRINQLVSQIEESCGCKSSQGFFFEFYPYSVITSTTTNMTTGYATKVMNLEWRTTQEIEQETNNN